MDYGGRKGAWVAHSSLLDWVGDERCGLRRVNFSRRWGGLEWLGILGLEDGRGWGFGEGLGRRG